MVSHDFCCSFRVHANQWSLRIKEDFVDIRCDALATVAQLQCDTITYEEVKGYTCSMNMNEVIFRGSNGITMTVNHSVPREEHDSDDECGYIEVRGNGHMSRYSIPAVIARAIPFIVKGQQDAVRDLGAYHITAI